MLRVFLLFLSWLYGASALFGLVESQILFVVNNQPIFEHSFLERTRFVLLMTGHNPDDASSRTDLYEVVKQGLIDELIQLKFVGDMGLKVTDTEIENAIDSMARGNGLTFEKMKALFAAKGVSFVLLKNQVKAQIAWSRYIQMRYVRDFAILPETLRLEKQRLQQQLGKTSYRMAEIVIYHHPQKGTNPVARIQEIMMMLQSGQPFQSLAQQFSESTSASKGGYVGWVGEEELELAAIEAFQGMSAGALSPPVRLSAGYALYVLLDKQVRETLPSDKEIENSLQNQRLERISRYELLKLRSKAVISDHRHASGSL